MGLSTGEKQMLVTAVAVAAGVAVVAYFVFRSKTQQKQQKQKLMRMISERKDRIKIKKLIIYPIKSCKGVKVEQAECTPYGLKNGSLRDRQFMVADAETGEFISARTQPTLVLVEPQYLSKSKSLLLTAPNMKTVTIDLDQLPRTEKYNVTIHGHSSEGIEVSTELSDWFSRYLRKSVRFLYFDPSTCMRMVEIPHGPGYMRQTRPPEITPVQTMFSDGYPYLLCTTESVDEIAGRIPDSEITYRNFRPNILVTGASRAYAEDEWRTLLVNDVVFFCEKPCGRCSLTTVDPETGTRNPKAEPLNTLNKVRKIVEWNKTSPIFGMNLILDSGPGFIHIGDQFFNYDEENVK